MAKDIELVENKKSKSFRQKKITEFLEEYADTNLEFNDERIKLCSSDDFNDVSESFKKIQKTR